MPRHSSEGWNPGKGEGSDERKCNEMRLNETKLKVSPLLATPTEPSQGHNRGRLAHRVRVSGVPNEGSAKLGHGLAHSHEARPATRRCRWFANGAASQLDALRELADLL